MFVFNNLVIYLRVRIDWLYADYGKTFFVGVLAGLPQTKLNDGFSLKLGKTKVRAGGCLDLHEVHVITAVWDDLQQTSLLVHV